ncbi:MAG: transposase [Limnochordaceae bacterium]|nr:transposase [Limnochordaceae bacterium]
MWGSGARYESLPEADEQRCWKHSVLNVLEQLPRYQHAAAKARLREIVYASTRAEAEHKRKEFEAGCRQHGYGKAVETLRRDWERMVTFYRYRKEHWDT